LTVIVEEPPPGAEIDDGLKLAEAPLGRPDADSDTVELKPPPTVVVAVVEPLAP